MASQTESCEGNRGSAFPEEKKNSLKKPTLRPIVTCSSSSSSFSSSSSSSSSSAASSPCSVFGASNSVSDADLRCSGEEICTTPKAKEYRIPDLLPCPPAPRKRRVRSRFHSAPLTGFFVVPPDLDSMFSIHKIPVKM